MPKNNNIPTPLRRLYFTVRCEHCKVISNVEDVAVIDGKIECPHGAHELNGTLEVYDYGKNNG